MSDTTSRVASVLLSLTHEGVLVLDGRNRVTTVNPRFLEWTGYQLGEVLGRDATSLWDDPSRWADWKAGFRLQGGAVPHETLDLSTKAGDSVPVEPRMAVVPRPWRRTPDTLVTLHDLRESRLLAKLVHEDPLSGVASRSEALARLADELARCLRFGTGLGVILMDIDGFRELNELWGPELGDQVLRVAGAELHDALRPTDLAGRVGSDEFLALLPQASAYQTEETAHQLRLALSQRLFAPHGVEVPVTASFGLAVVRSHDPVSQGQVLARVAEALDRARARGRNRVEFSP